MDAENLMESNYEGTIVVLAPARGGLILTQSKKVKFSILDIDDRKDVPPAIGDWVVFTLGGDAKEPLAKSIRRKVLSGVVTFFSPNKEPVAKQDSKSPAPNESPEATGRAKESEKIEGGAISETPEEPKPRHGYIYASDGKSYSFESGDVAYDNLGPANLKRDDYVTFVLSARNGPSKGQRLFVRNIKRSDNWVGSVTAWSNVTGVGKIVPEGGADNSSCLDFSSRDVVRYGSDRPIKIARGDLVSFLPAPKGDFHAVCVRKEYALRCFASLGDETQMLKTLAEEEALEESWTYPGLEGRGPYPILWSYLLHTFERLQVEDYARPDEDKKIRIVNPQQVGGKAAVFDTGLVDKQYRVLYAVFKERHPRTIGKPSWILVGFCHRGGRLGNRYLTLFRELPPRAEYFQNPADLVYDPQLRLDAITDHIIEERGNRLPRSILKKIPPGMVDPDEISAVLTELLERAITRAKDRIRWNYKTAVPHYYPPRQKIQLLLPLCIDDPRHVDVALAVEREGEAYVGYTILPLEWAYSNARLIARPHSDWLEPDKVSSDAETDQD